MKKITLPSIILAMGILMTSCGESSVSPASNPPAADTTGEGPAGGSVSAPDNTRIHVDSSAIDKSGNIMKPGPETENTKRGGIRSGSAGVESGKNKQ